MEENKQTELRESLKLVSEPFVLARYCFFPMSRREKETRLNQVREIVDYFIPRIEEKSGVKIGEVQVKSMSRLPRDITPLIMDWCDEWVEKAQLSGVERVVGKAILKTTARPIITLFSMLKEDFTTMLTVAQLNTIYVPFGFSSKMDYFWEKKFPKEREYQIVAHELAHILWQAINPQDKLSANSTNLDNYQFWSEGFATFCEQEYFSDIFLEGRTPEKIDWSERYAKGREQVRKVLDIGGEQALLSIPLRWERWQQRLSSEDGEKPYKAFIVPEAKDENEVIRTLVLNSAFMTSCYIGRNPKRQAYELKEARARFNTSNRVPVDYPLVSKNTLMEGLKKRFGNSTTNEVELELEPYCDSIGFEPTRLIDY